MATATCKPLSLEPSSQGSSPPLRFFYAHFHDSIRSELDALSQSVLGLDGGADQRLLDRLLVLKKRYHFLEQVYNYHSSVEDEVVYPALDLKVKNVTSAYSREHEDEEHLFEQLSKLLATAISQTGKDQLATVRLLVCKVEEIHTTLRKHLAKEEEQLFPLLLQHFTHAEQAELVAQFLCCIPLTTVDAVLSWLKPSVPQQEQEELLQQVRGVVPDHLLLQLLVTWLSPAAMQQSKPIAAPRPEDSPQGCCRTKPTGSDCRQQQSNERPPLQGIKHLHGAIRGALQGFSADARALQKGQAKLEASQLAALAERHRFLRAVCKFHALSEDEVLFPAARNFVPEGQSQPELCDECELEHTSEAADMELLGRLLGDVRACVRRGAKEVSKLLDKLVEAADRLAKFGDEHMTREEEAVLPFLEAHMCVAEQRAVVWRTLRAMPLRLLERMLPWVAGQLSDAESAELLRNMRLAAPEVDADLVELLARWTMRGRQPAERPQQTHSHQAPRTSPSRAHEAPSPQGPPAKRRRMNRPQEQSPLHQGPSVLSVAAGAQAARPGRPAGCSSANPIDHIFQFHKVWHAHTHAVTLTRSHTRRGRRMQALRVELHAMEASAASFATSLEHSPSPEQLTGMKQLLEGRFRFLWGIYRAHSESEDEIVFPALEAKEALHNVSHAYTLDHQKEEQMFEDLDQVFRQLRASCDPAELPSLTGQLQRMCAAVRATLEQHVRAEEQELWPLFAENFSVAEQEDIVGRIIGRTGAEALQAMLPWVASSFTDEEQRAMMESLRNASRNTMFERWLESAMTQPGARGSAPEAAQAASEAGPEAGRDTAVSEPEAEEKLRVQREQQELASFLPSREEPSSKDATTFRPGWEAIFRMNQKQLEVAMRRVWNDSSLEAKRKAYLMQHIMASRYIVAQQQKQGSEEVPALPHGSAARTFHDQQGTVLGCAHYKRRCQLVAPCCERVYTCRHCHDEAEDHRLQQTIVQHMICMECGLQQPVAGDCSKCGTSMAQYFCSICRLWDDQPGRSIYHCPFCNLCRLGQGLGADACHCMHCNACMALSEFPHHKCRDLSTCPVCTEYLFDSAQPYRELPCGHFIHSHCFAQYTRYNYTCPVCAKSLGDMTVYFRMIDSLVQHDLSALPSAYSTRIQSILCNDCEQKSQAPFHFVYHCCEHCRSYNTRVL